MKRWNGWGEEEVNFPLSPLASKMLQEKIGPGEVHATTNLQDILTKIPPSRLPDKDFIDQGEQIRLTHSCGQSLPDWIELRFGKVKHFTDGVCFPTTTEEVESIISLAKREKIALIPYGGGTSVLGHIKPVDNVKRPVLTVNLQKMSNLFELNETNRLARFGAGILGPNLEAALNKSGYTLGHFPQSFEYSTLGGWIATKSSGQQSLGYGRIDQLFQGGLCLTPSGRINILPNPGSAAGPDLKELILGSEGRFGFITEALVKINPLPEKEEFLAVFFPDWEQGCLAARTLVQGALPLSMIRLSNPLETAISLVLSGHDKLIGPLKKYLAWRHVYEQGCLLMIGFSGKKHKISKASKEIISLLKRQFQAVYLGKFMGQAWKKNRFKAPYLRNTLWEKGYAVDTLETAVPWDQVTPIMHRIESALGTALADEGERAIAFSHLSHLYPTGSSIYTTFLFRIASSADLTLKRWQRLKQAASKAIIASKGTISHHHGVGLDHRDYLIHEKGALGIKTLQTICNHFDPQQCMNPGKLIS